MSRKKFKKPPELVGYNFSPMAARRARNSGRLLSLRVETSQECNLKCLYCNSSTEFKPPDEISFDQIKQAILQAKALGARSVVVTGGGEPTIYPQFPELVKFINQENLIPVIFTNGQELTARLAKFLFKENASVLFKLDSFKAAVQDRLCHKKGSFWKILRCLENLLAAGFNRNGINQLRAGISFVVTKINYQDTPEIWRFCRANHLYPNLEQLVPRNRGLKHLKNLQISNRTLNQLKQKLLDFDRKKYGYNWLVHSPLAGQGCFQTFYSLYLTSTGYLQPCADIAIERFNIKNFPLAEVLKKPFFQLARHVDQKLTGACASCRYHSACIGCRGIAFTTGINQGLSPEAALCAPDPLCYKTTNTTLVKK
jgi:radical SAM protein with 4Fe4S-binding SPASM domain